MKLINSSLLFLFVGVIISSCGTDSSTPENQFFLESNSVTIRCPETSPGDKGIVNDTEFESVDNELLRNKVQSGADLTKVCTSLVTDMSELFNGTYEEPYNFNQSISSWDVSSVTDMNSMFYRSKFNQHIGEWDVSNVIDMSSMFHDSHFNQDISSWDVSNVVDMSGMFTLTPFDYPIGNWIVSNVTNMRSMFAVSGFNQDISQWDVSNVTDMGGMFNESDFNQQIGDWEVSKVENMSYMFQSTAFNQPIGSWDVSSVANMENMFFDAYDFNQNISTWCVQFIQTEPDEFSTLSALTEENKPIWGTCPE